MEQHRHAIRRGTITEFLIAAHFTSLGCSVSIPLSHNQPYDLVIDGGDYGLSRIQVKRSFSAVDKPGGYKVDIGSGYVGDEFDYLVTLTPDNKYVYIIPINEILERSSNFKVYGDESIPVQSRSNFEKYRTEFSTI